MARKLHIGGEVRAPGWEVLNVLPGPHVDHLGNANTLKQFADGTFGEIYASHVLEHLDYRGEIESTLREWHRVLAPGGRLRVSVPDMDRLAEMFLAKDQLGMRERFLVMTLIFGGHADAYDHHQVGLNEEFLAEYLRGSGFVNARRVEDFGLFEDTSRMVVAGVPISLNMVADKPPA